MKKLVAAGTVLAAIAFTAGAASAPTRYAHSRVVHGDRISPTSGRLG